MPIDVKNIDEVVQEGPPPPLNLQTLLAGPPEVLPGKATEKKQY